MSIKLSVAEQLTLQKLLKKAGSVESLVENVKTFSLDDSKTIYGYGYTRVSDPRNDPESLVTQEQILRNYAKSIGVTIIEVYSDFGISGGEPAEKRKGFMHVLMELQPGMKLVGSRADRLFRDRKEKDKVKDWLAAKNVTMAAPDYKADEEFNKAANLPNEILEVVNEHYRHVTAEKVKLGLRQKSADGTLRTKPYYGWRFDGKGKPWLPIEYEQNAIKKIEELKLANPKMTNGMIMEELTKADFKYARKTYNEDGTDKKESKWTYGLIQSILTRLGLATPTGVKSNQGSISLDS
jgi:DNA invertase Pin-like site-specific DNA recombinase